MKKIIAVLLTMLMIFSVCSAGVFALGDIDRPTSEIVVHSSRSQVPVIRLLGDGEPLYDKDQKKLFHIRSFYLPKDEEGEESDIMGSMANVLFPFLVDGLLTDN